MMVVETCKWTASVLSTTLIFAYQQVPPRATSRERIQLSHVDARLLCEPRHDCRGGSVWVGSALKKYRIIEIYVFAAWKPVLNA